MASISIALSKGRIFDETAPLLARVGIRPKENPDRSRKLVIGTNRRVGESLYLGQTVEHVLKDWKGAAVLVAT